jgi:hypothetical protein
LNKKIENKKSAGKWEPGSPGKEKKNKVKNTVLKHFATDF